MSITNGRDAALEALRLCRVEERFAEDALTIVCEELDTREAALAYHLCMGVLQKQSYLDFCIEQYRKTTHMQPVLLDILRIGAYQVLFSDKIPTHAAVNEAAKQAALRSPSAVALVNAVLRKVAAFRTTPPKLPANKLEAVSIKYNLPLWALNIIDAELGGDHAEAFAKASGNNPPTILIKNPLKQADFSQLTPMHGFIDAYNYDGQVTGLRAFQRGEFLVADVGARIIAEILTAAIKTPNPNIWDTCAAPGGKSFLMAMLLDDKCSILSTDIAEKKLSKICEGAERLGINSITPMASDASKALPNSLFDAVLCDVPCSGFGVLRKKPDIRYKAQNTLTRLPTVQRNILENASKAVKSGGLLMYTTCTVFKSENENVIEGFLGSHPEFSLAPFEVKGLGIRADGMTTLLPHLHGTDGFFICLLQKAE